MRTGRLRRTGLAVRPRLPATHCRSALPASAGSHGGTATNDFAIGTVFGGLEFTGSDAFTLGGNGINFGGSIINSSSELQLISNDLALTADVSIDTSGEQVTLSGVLSGSFGFTKTGQNHMRLTGANTFTGTMTNTAGLLFIQETGSVDSGVSATLGGYDTTDTEARLRVDGVGGETKVINGVTLVPGRSRLHAERSSGSGQFILDVGAITRQTGAVMTINLNSSDIVTTATNTNGILGGWAMNGNGRDFLTVNEDGELTSYSDYTDLSGAGTSQQIASDATANVRITNNSESLSGMDTVDGSATVTVADTSGLSVGDLISNASGIADGTEIISIDSATTFTLANPASSDGTGVSGDVYDPVVTLPGSGVTDVNTIIKQYGGDGTDYPRTIEVGDGNTLRLGQYGAIKRAEVDESSGFRYPKDTLTIDGGVLTAGGADNTDGEIVFSTNGRHTNSSGNESRNNIGIDVTSEVQDNGTGVVSVVIDSDQSTRFSGAASADTYSGGTYITSGRLVSTVNGNIGTGDVTVHSGGTNGGQLHLMGGGTYANDMAIAGFGYSAGAPSALHLTDDTSISGDITLIADAGISADGTTTVSGPVDGAGHRVTFYGSAGSNTSSEITLTNASSDFSGGIRLQNRAGNFTSGSPFVVNIGTSGLVFGDLDMIDGARNRKGSSSTWLRLQGNDLTVGGLSNSAGDGRVYIQNSTDPGATATLTIGEGSTGYSLMTDAGEKDYLIEDGDPEAVLNLVKVGSGTQEFAGSLNRYTGTTTINEGTLLISGTLTGTSGIFVNGGTFAYTNDATALDRDITLDGGTIQYSSAMDHTGTLIFNSGVLGGTNWNGSLDGQDIGANRTVSPGNSIGEATGTNQTWSDGGTFVVEMDNPDGIAGEGWDLISLAGELDVSGLTEGGFMVQLVTLDSEGAFGLLEAFDQGQEYSWEIANFDSIVGTVTPDLIGIDTSEFENPYSGWFEVEQSDNGIFLSYNIPEPETVALIFAAVAGVVVVLRRRKRSVA